VRKTIAFGPALIGGLALAPLAAASPAAATVSASSNHSARLEHLSVDDVLAIAGNLVDAGRYDEAQALLDRLAQDNTGGIERDFLAGMIALARKDYAHAEHLFRKILEGNPNLLRVRLELARTLFLKGEDEQADYNFRLAIADHPPEAVARNIARFREAIRQRRAWRVNVEFGIAPDNNINSATSKEQVDILGVRFKLNPDARAKSGVGNFVGGDVSLRLLRDQTVPVYLAAYARALRYPDHAYNDVYVGGEVGPEFRLQGGRLRATGTLFQRWYGGKPLATSYGGRLDYEKVIGGKWGVEATLALHRDDYAHRHDLDSWNLETGITANRALSPSTTGFGYLLLRRSAAVEDGYSYWNSRLGLGVLKEISWGLRPQVSLEVGRQVNDAPMPLFDLRRRDWTLQASASIYKRDWNVVGFAPTLKLTYNRDFSTIALYDLRRLRAEFGLTKAF
jgi:tetratricopeptide (TPR) repeat protein